MPRKSYTQEEFINKSTDKHKGRFDYSLVEYIDYKTEVKIICKEHGVFEQKPTLHLQGSKCKICSSTERGDKHRKTNYEFIIDSILVHGNTYNYDKIVYTNNATPVIIGCPIHGDFPQIPIHHTTGSGCPDCGSSPFWKRSEYIKKANNKICTFYVLKCYNKDEKFYKIGLTMNSIKIRYGSKKSIPYQYEVISEIKGQAGEIWDLEIMEKRKLKEFKYQPNKSFPGSKTECFIKYKLD